MADYIRKLINRDRNKGGKAGATLPDGTFPDATLSDAALPDAAPVYMVETKPAGTTLADNPPTGDTQKSLTSYPATQTCHIHHCISQPVNTPCSTSHPIIQREENPDPPSHGNCCNIFLVGWPSQVLYRDSDWYREKVDFDIVTPPPGSRLRKNAPTRSGIIIGNTIQQRIEVDVMGQVLACPLAVENALRRAMLDPSHSPELGKFWLKLQDNLNKWIKDTEAGLLRFRDEEKEDELRIYQTNELLCQHVHWHCEHGCCKTRDWKGVFTKATLSLCEKKIRLEGTGRETFGGAYFSATILVFHLVDHVKEVRQRSPEEILDWWINGADILKVLN
jgi:hypothetical protein